jgi:hypothetical protein
MLCHVALVRSTKSPFVAWPFNNSHKPLNYKVCRLLGCYTVRLLATRRNIPEDGFLHSHRRENLKSKKR